MKTSTLFILIFISLYSEAQSRSTQSFLGDVSVIEFGANGNVWIGSASGGCDGYTAATDTWAHFNTGNSSMKSDTITCISLFAITGVPHSFMGSTNGIGYKHGTAWDTIASLVNPYVIDMAHSLADHRFYVGTKGGISVYNDTSLQHLSDLTTISTTLPYGNISCFHSKPLVGAGFYYGTTDSGYYYSADAVNYTHRTVANSGLSDNQVTCIFAKPSGGAEWVGTKNGYNECQSGTCTNFTASVNSIHQNDISAVDADFRGNAWVGTRDSGIAIYNHNTLSWQYITSVNGLPSNRITAINCKNTGDCNCYVGTADGGSVMIDSFLTVQQLPTIIKTVEKEQINVVVFPQPSSDVLNFFTDSEIKTGAIELYDIHGKFIFDYKMNNQSSAVIHANNMEPGFYFYVIKNENAVVKTGKVYIVR